MPAKTSAKRPARDDAREAREHKIAAKIVATPQKRNKKRKRRRGNRITQFALTVEAAGAMAGMSKSAAHRAAKNGIIPVIGEGRNRIVPRLIWEEKLGIKPGPHTAKEIAPVA